jgi:endo-1,4-beta-xylanase
MHNIRKPIFAAIAIVLAVVASSCHTKAPQAKPASLKEALADKFYIGTALDSLQIIGVDTSSLKLVLQHFNAITAENCMKSEVIQPEEGKFDFALADQFVDFGVKNHMKIIGHTLVWHSQSAKWFFVDKDGKDVPRDTLIARMKKHITTIVGRYKGRVHGWDVVNESFEDDGAWRKTKFYTIIGEDYVRLAFEFAHQADPDAELYYNDYSMAKPGRRESVIKLVNDLKSKGVRIDVIGMQGHMTTDYPAINDYEKSIVDFAATGAKVAITEMDITVLPSPRQDVGADVATNFEYQQALNPYANGLPDSVATVLHNRYASMFDLFLKHSDKIDRVTIWGVNDAQSWRNYWPIFGRTDYPLLFDRQNKPKPIVATIIEKATATSTDVK